MIYLEKEYKALLEKENEIKNAEVKLINKIEKKMK